MRTMASTPAAVLMPEAFRLFQIFAQFLDDVAEPDQVAILLGEVY